MLWGILCLWGTPTIKDETRKTVCEEEPEEEGLHTNYIPVGGGFYQGVT